MQPTASPWQAFCPATAPWPPGFPGDKRFRAGARGAGVRDGAVSAEPSHLQPICTRQPVSACGSDFKTEETGLWGQQTSRPLRGSEFIGWLLRAAARQDTDRRAVRGRGAGPPGPADQQSARRRLSVLVRNPGCSTPPLLPARPSPPSVQAATADKDPRPCSPRHGPASTPRGGRRRRGALAGTGAQSISENRGPFAGPRRPGCSRAGPGARTAQHQGPRRNLE